MVRSSVCVAEQGGGRPALVCRACRNSTLTNSEIKCRADLASIKHRPFIYPYVHIHMEININETGGGEAGPSFD